MFVPEQRDFFKGCFMFDLRVHVAPFYLCLPPMLVILCQIFFVDYFLILSSRLLLKYVFNLFVCPGFSVGHISIF